MKIKHLFLIGLSSLLLLASCQPDQQAMTALQEEAKKIGFNEGKKFGYDSAMAIAMDTTSKFFHPPYDGHVHSLSIRGGNKPQLGLMFLSLRDDHDPQFFLDFYNNNQITFKPDQTVDPNAQNHTATHFEKRVIWINRYDAAGNVIARAPLAIDLTPVIVKKK